MTDPIADMLTQIRNAALVNQKQVNVRFSKMKLEIAKILKQEGYIADIENVKDSELFPYGHISISLKYGENGTVLIRHLERISKPGQRIYVDVNMLPRVKNGLGTAIISTSQGILTDRDARKKRIGGELLCTIW